jgi:hypothetical protein
MEGAMISGSLLRDDTSGELLVKNTLTGLHVKEKETFLMVGK